MADLASASNPKSASDGAHVNGHLVNGVEAATMNSHSPPVSTAASGAAPMGPPPPGSGPPNGQPATSEPYSYNYPVAQKPPNQHAHPPAPYNNGAERPPGPQDPGSGVPPPGTPTLNSLLQGRHPRPQHPGPPHPGHGYGPPVHPGGHHGPPPGQAPGGYPPPPGWDPNYYRHVRLFYKIRQFDVFFHLNVVIRREKWHGSKIRQFVV